LLIGIYTALKVLTNSSGNNLKAQGCPEGWSTGCKE